MALQAQQKEFNRPLAVEKSWENLKNRFKSPNAIDSGEKILQETRRWSS